MEERNELIKELFELHKLLADKGEISIGYGFSENYNRLEAKVKKLTIPVVMQSCDTCKHLSTCRFWQEAPNNGATCKFYIEHVA